MKKASEIMKNNEELILYKQELNDPANKHLSVGDITKNFFKKYPQFDRTKIDTDKKIDEILNSIDVILFDKLQYEHNLIITKLINAIENKRDLR